MDTKILHNLRKRIPPSSIKKVSMVGEFEDNPVDTFLQKNDVAPGLFSSVEGTRGFGRCDICGSRNNVEEYDFVPRGAQGKPEQYFKADVCDECVMKLHGVDTPDEEFKLSL
ncbi:MAG: hypothetical protein QXE52_07985 [Candidatus Caldarchaeum sp.]